MEVPSNIIEAIKDAGKYTKKSFEENEQIRNWLIEIGEDENDLIIDQLIDNLELGVDGSRDFIKFLKSQ